MIEQRIDRWMRTRSAPVVVPAIVAIVTMAAGSARWAHGGAADAVAPAASATLWIGLTIFFTCCALFGVYSWRRLWREGRTPYEMTVYDLGVRRFGALLVLAAPLISLVSTGRVAMAQGTETRWLLLIPFTILTRLAVGLPLGLWSGYLWGRIMARLFRQPPGAR